MIVKLRDRAFDTVAFAAIAYGVWVFSLRRLHDSSVGESLRALRLFGGLVFLALIGASFVAVPTVLWLLYRAAGERARPTLAACARLALAGYALSLVVRYPLAALLERTRGGEDRRDPTVAPAADPDAGGRSAPEGSTDMSRAREPQRPTVWAPAGTLRVQRSHYALAALPSGGAIVVGGFVRGGADELHEWTTTTETWDPASGSFALGPELLSPMVAPTAVWLTDGRLLVLEAPAPGHPPRPQVWRPGEATWRHLPPPPTTAGSDAAVVLADGRVLCVEKGWHRARPGESGRALLFDPRTERWSTVAMRDNRTGAAVTRLEDGSVLVSGGKQYEDIDPPTPLSTAELFEPGSDRFVPLPSMQHGRLDHASVSLGDGRVLLFGSRSYGEAATSSEVFDPEQRRFRPGPRNVGPQMLPALRLEDGRVVALGGRPERTPAEIFDPARDRWEPIDRPPVRCRFERAVRLRDGRALVVCENGGRRAPPNAALLFDPRAVR